MLRLRSASVRNDNIAVSSSAVENAFRPNPFCTPRLRSASIRNQRPPCSSRYILIYDQATRTDRLPNVSSCQNTRPLDSARDGIRSTKVMRIKHFGKWIFSRVMLNWFQVDVYLFNWFLGVERNDNIAVSSSAQLSVRAQSRTPFAFSFYCTPRLRSASVRNQQPPCSSRYILICDQATRTDRLPNVSSCQNTRPLDSARDGIRSTKVMRIKHFGKWIFSCVMLNWFQVDVYLFKWFLGVERSRNHRKPHLPVVDRAGINNHHAVLDTSFSAIKPLELTGCPMCLHSKTQDPSTQLGMTNAQQIR